MVERTSLVGDDPSSPPTPVGRQSSIVFAFHPRLSRPFVRYVAGAPPLDPVSIPPVLPCRRAVIHPQGLPPHPHPLQARCQGPFPTPRFSHGRRTHRASPAGSPRPRTGTGRTRGRSGLSGEGPGSHADLKGRACGFDRTVPGNVWDFQPSKPSCRSDTDVQHTRTRAALETQLWLEKDHDHGVERRR
eukprot:scaffold2858_cov659-Pavlova_lutheri.AAC.111